MPDLTAVVASTAIEHAWLAVAMDGTVTDVGLSPPGQDVPPGKTVVTREQYDTALDARAHGGSLRYINGVLKLGVIPTPTPPTMDQLRASATQRIDEAAETARLQFVTAGSGQALEYQATQVEAETLLAAHQATPDATFNPATFSWLAAEQSALAAVNVTVSLLQVAQAVKATADAWEQTGAAIKRVRRTAKLQVTGATTPEQVAAILAGLAWPQPTS